MLTKTKLQALHLSGLLSLAFLANHGKANEEKLQSKLDITSSQQATNINLNFKIEPTSGKQLNYEAPWKLVLSEESGIDLEKKEWDAKSLDKGLPGFHVEARKNSETKPLSINYKLYAFVCTQDKKQCFRDVHTGKLDLSAKK